MANVETTVFTCGTVIDSATNTSSYSGILIADLGVGATSVPAYGNDNIPTPTQVGGRNVSACVEIQSTDGAFLLPRMTTVQRDAVAVPTNGMMIYNTTTNEINSYENGVWGAAGGGDVVGPGAATNDSVAVFNGITGKLIQNTGVILNPITGIFSAIGGLINAIGSAASPTYTFTGDTNTGIFSPIPDTVTITGGGNTITNFVGATTNVNFLSIVSSDTGFGPLIIADGEANVPLNLSSSGNSSIFFKTNINDVQASISATANPVNRINFTGAAAAAFPTITTIGSDGTIPLVIAPKNQASTQFNSGTSAAPGIAFNGGATSQGTGLTLNLGGGASSTYLAFCVNGAIRGALNQNNVISLGTNTFDATMLNGISFTGTSTVPTGVAGNLQIYGANVGGNNGTLGITIPAPSFFISADNVTQRKVQISVNGTTLYLLATLSAA